MAYPIPTSYPVDEVQCVLDCAAGTCKDSPQQQLHAHAVVGDYLQSQGGASPCPGGNCSLENLKDLHKMTAGKRAAMPINWLSLAQMVFTMLIQILSSLTPPAPPAPPKP